MNIQTSQVASTPIKVPTPAPKEEIATTGRNVTGKKSAETAAPAKESTPPVTEETTTEVTQDSTDKTEFGPVAEYLKTINRLEKMIMSGEMEPEEVNKAIDKLEEKLMSLNPTQKGKLMALAFFKKHNLENLKDLKATLSEVLQDPTQRREGFEFLKDPQLIKILDPSLEIQKSTYGPANRTYAAQSSEQRLVTA